MSQSSLLSPKTPISSHHCVIKPAKNYTVVYFLASSGQITYFHTPSVHTKLIICRPPDTSGYRHTRPRSGTSANKEDGHATLSWWHLQNPTREWKCDFHSLVGKHEGGEYPLMCDNTLIKASERFAWIYETLLWYHSASATVSAPITDTPRRPCICTANTARPRRSRFGESRYQKC